MRYYDKLATYERNGFTVIVDKTWEDDIDPSQAFEECDVKEITRKIYDGTYDWFMLRVRVMLDGYEMGSSYLGGCCYENASDVLTDGTAEDIIYSALEEAKTQVWPLMRKLQAINAEMEKDAITVE